VKRPFHVHYARTQTNGYCATQGGAIKSVVRYLVNNEQRRATIEAPDGKVIRVEYTGFWGLIIQVDNTAKPSARIIPFKKRNA